MSRIQQPATGWNWMKWKLVRENAPSEPEMGSFAPMGSYSRKPVAAVTDRTTV